MSWVLEGNQLGLATHAVELEQIFRDRCLRVAGNMYYGKLIILDDLAISAWFELYRLGKQYVISIYSDGLPAKIDSKDADKNTKINKSPADSREFANENDNVVGSHFGTREI